MVFKFKKAHLGNTILNIPDNIWFYKSRTCSRNKFGFSGQWWWFFLLYIKFSSNILQQVSSCLNKKKTKNQKPGEFKFTCYEHKIKQKSSTNKTAIQAFSILRVTTAVIREENSAHTSNWKKELSVIHVTEKSFLFFITAECFPK